MSGARAASCQGGWENRQEEGEEKEAEEVEEEEERQRCTCLHIYIYVYLFYMPVCIYIHTYSVLLFNCFLLCPSLAVPAGMCMQQQLRIRNLKLLHELRVSGK